MTVDMQKIIKEIEQEAETKKRAPAHPDFLTLKGGEFRLRPHRPNFLVRIWQLIREEKLGAFRKLYKVKGVGYALKCISIILRLPRRLEQIYSDMAESNSRIAQLSFQTQSLSTNLLSARQAIVELEHKNKVIREFADKQNAFLIEQINAMKTQGPKSGVTRGDSHPSVSQQKDKDYDAFYLAFEEKFRGSANEILTKQKAYISKLREFNVSDSMVALDIGCGRGEWLGLLRDEGFLAFGVDMNSSMVEECLSKGLKAVETDAMSYLKLQPDNSLDLITSFHVVEHINFDDLFELFTECRRVLRKNGLIIFETPNPENLIVAGCNFYTDPSHLRPIPPHSMAFYAEHKGFGNIQIVRSSPVRPAPYSEDHLINEIAGWLFREQDYAIIAQKI